MGWGPEELGSYNYWGGKSNFKKNLEDKGYTIFEVSVGPVSSNWDRAVECYYQLKGGQVDYGKSHSEKYNINQKSDIKIYPGLYPEWNSNNPIHVIGHSMGGQTARMLNYLLANQIYEDQENKILEKSTLLGESNHNMIKSITTIATPHDGTTLTKIVTKTIPFINYFVGLAGIVGTEFYDFDLDQFSFFRENESWLTYLSRLRSHNAWSTKNIASWDLSLDGAKELNSYLISSPEIYYFSIVTTTTEKRGSDSFFHDPVPSTSVLIKTRSKLIGTRIGYWADGNKTDSLWFENDGIVNTISMYGPTKGTNGSDIIVKYEESEILIPGQWYWIKVPKMDHWSIIGHLGDIERMKIAETLLINHCSRLKNLPDN